MSRIEMKVLVERSYWKNIAEALYWKLSRIAPPAPEFLAGVHEDRDRFDAKDIGKEGAAEEAARALRSAMNDRMSAARIDAMPDQPSEAIRWEGVEQLSYGYLKAAIENDEINTTGVLLWHELAGPIMMWAHDVLGPLEYMVFDRKPYTHFAIIKPPER